MPVLALGRERAVDSLYISPITFPLFRELQVKICDSFEDRRCR